MAPPTAFSSDQLIDPQMSLDPQFLVPTDDSVSSDLTKSTHLFSEYNDTSLKLPSTENNSDSLVETKDFLKFVDELSQEPSPLSDREGTSNQDDTVPSVKVEDSFHSTNVVDKTSENVNSSFESQDISIDKVPKDNGVESTDISITESQFSSTMPYCEESIVAKLDPEGASKFLSAQLCHKEDTTLSHESADFISDLGISEDSTKDCSSGTSASNIATEDTHVKIPICLILFLTIILNLQLIMVICKLVNVLILKSLYLCHRGRVHLIVTLSPLPKLKLMNLINPVLHLFR